MKSNNYEEQRERAAKINSQIKNLINLKSSHLEQNVFIYTLYIKMSVR